ncbi:MAG: bifunctional folylpolyglutamate synthase/dihydrofolate synthase [Gemmatimonadetes bacterium]|nr:bifunctional folylpolyglutamate synthase/dihydrofolate synthase [Gemmatimonadota bacterium]
MTAMPLRDDLVTRLFPPLERGVHWGLDVTRGLLAAAGDPHLGIPSIHVGGTNGKGSVAATCASVLAAAGRRVGLYTSPHLCSFRERFQVDGRPVDETVLAAAAAELRSAVEAWRPSFFEATTALAFTAFARERVDIAVIEVGLGGRLDATNVITPLVSAITNVALDHAEYLGPTLADIAREKAGIIKPAVPAVTAEPDDAIRSILEEIARERGAPLCGLHPQEIRDTVASRERTAFTLSTDAWGELRVSTPLLGPHQAVNAAVAALSLERLPSGLRPAADEVVRGVAGVRWPGRLQVERLDATTWVFDVAHNTAGMHALADALRRLDFPRPLVGVVGILGDKDWRAMLPPLFRITDAALLTQPSSAPQERRWDPHAVAAAVPLPPLAEIEMDLEAALERAGEWAGAGTVVVTGSCHTVGDALALLDLVPLASPTSHEALPASAGAV